ncbi:MAG: DUF2997 domain-containing protein [Planctomycetaceae bacterium]|nr:DUF2997 domain-containing protein [Planctomycetaceae bacterium]
MTNTASKTIDIIVAPDGQTRVETRGFVGSVCRDASRFIEQALGRTTGEQLKAEYYQTASAEQQVRNGH